MTLKNTEQQRHFQIKVCETIENFGHCRRKTEDKEVQHFKEV